MRAKNAKKKPAKEQVAESESALGKISIDFIEEVLDLKNYSFNETPQGTSRTGAVFKSESKQSLSKGQESGSVVCVERSDALKLIDKVGELEPSQFERKLTRLLEKKLDKEEEAVEVFAEFFGEMVKGLLTEDYLQANQARIKDMLFGDHDEAEARPEADKETAERGKSKVNKGGDKPSNFFKNENKFPGMEVSQSDQSMMGTVKNNKGNIFVLKSPFLSETFYYTFDECLLCSSPFETRRNSDALRLFQKFYEFCPVQLKNQPIYNQNFRDPSFFDIAFLGKPVSESPDKYAGVRGYFGHMGLFGRNFGFRTLVDLNSLFVKDPNFESIKDSASQSNSMEAEKIMRNSFFQLLEFLIWIRSNSPADQSKDKPTSEHPSTGDKDLFTDLKLKSAKAAKKRVFDVNEYKGSPFFFLYKVELTPELRRASRENVGRAGEPDGTRAGARESVSGGRGAHHARVERHGLDIEVVEVFLQ